MTEYHAALQALGIEPEAVEEIEVRILCGESLDAAMQSVLCIF